MPEPRPELFTTPAGAIWPATLPLPQADIALNAPARAEPQDVLYGPVRLRVRARTAPAEWRFTCWFTQAEMQAFETWYRALIDLTGGEFYAPWIGGARLTAFADAYAYTPLGKGWELQGRLIRTRIDPSICDDVINAAFGNILRDDGVSANIVRDDGASANIIRDEFALSLIAANGC